MVKPKIHFLETCQRTPALKYGHIFPVETFPYLLLLLDVLASNIKIVIECYLETINDTKISNYTVLKLK